MSTAAPSSGRIRVAYVVSPSEHFAGIERVVHEIASGLVALHGDAVEVHVVFASGYDEPVLVDPPYRKHVLGVRRLLELPFPLRRRMRAIAPDVVVVPQVEASVLAWLATRGLGIAHLVPHLHGNPRLEERDGSRSTKVAFRIFRRVVAPRVPMVLAVSPSLRDHAARELAPGTAVEYVPNPVRDFSETGRLPRTDAAFRFLSVGRLSVQKGQDVLLRALAAARPELPHVRLQLVGTGPEEAALRQLVDALDLSDVVEFTGYTSDPSEAFRSADAFVLTSRWEGFGVVLVEALRFGLPLTVVDCEFGPRDVVADDRIGRVVPLDDQAALAAALVEAARSVSTEEDRAARQQHAQAWSTRPAAAAHLGALQRVVGRGRGRAQV